MTLHFLACVERVAANFAGKSTTVSPGSDFHGQKQFQSILSGDAGGGGCCSTQKSGLGHSRFHQMGYRLQG